jgi:hypothetical protein
MSTWSRVRLVLGVSLVAVLTPAIALVAVQPADAFNVGSCRFSSSTVKVSVVSSYVTATNDAIKC